VKNVFQSLTANLAKGVRHDQMEGRDYLVAPMVMIVEGVLNGSNGPLLYPKEELEKTPVVWNHKPIVVYHPSKNGQPISACDPDVITSRKVGVIMNTKFEKGKLKAEAWLDPKRLAEVDARVAESIESGKVVEVSTGLFTDNEALEGEWEGKEYKGIARNYRPDHLAILPDQVGACSVQDGAGLLQLNMSCNILQGNFTGNEQSYGSTMNALDGLIRKKNEKAWVTDVYDAFAVYALEGKLWKQAYQRDPKSEKVTLVGVPVEVVRVTEYRTLDGKFVGNSHKGGKTMDKKAVVDALIANKASGYSEEDREALMAMGDAQLEKLAKLAANVVQPAPKPEVKPVETKPEVNLEKKPQTVEEYIANAPEGMRDVLLSGMASHDREKQVAIGQIMANKANPFSKEQLQGKPLAELQGMAKLAASTVEKKPTQNYAGQGDVAPVSEIKEEPLAAPVMNFGQEQAKK